MQVSQLMLFHAFIETLIDELVRIIYFFVEIYPLHA